MANNNKAAEFLKKVISDEALKVRLAGKAPAQAAAVAAELGFEVTEDELLAAEKELRAQSKKSSAEVVELDTEDMDRAAGGSFWRGDTASDGHEMGCALFYHSYEYSKETNEWCTNDFHFDYVLVPGYGALTPEKIKKIEEEKNKSKS
ncbi:MAG: Nif11 family protein [Ruminiclostridium sp.]|nr:Nif11 family protein [Ruminiclostridium sp.]